jgi:hypothetical protein
VGAPRPLFIVLSQAPMLFLRASVRTGKLSFNARALASASLKFPARLKLAPAGVTDISEFVNPSNNLFYLDKSAFIRSIEEASRVVVLLRPQRWGKTTFSNMLADYYDVARSAKPLVRISSGNTLQACSFSMLRFDLANVARALPGVLSGAEAVKVALDAEVRYSAKRFIFRYKVTGVDVNEPVLDLLCALGLWARSRGAPLYVIVDEYDALLRSLQIVSGSHIKSTLAGREGPLREFFGRIKSLHDSGEVSRVFLTGEFVVGAFGPRDAHCGVACYCSKMPTLRTPFRFCTGISPVGLECMTAAFNCFTDISQDASMNAAIGFSSTDVSDAIKSCLGLPVRCLEHAAVLSCLTRWGDGYGFAANLDQGMFQSTLVVQLLRELAQRPPQISLDTFLSQWTPPSALQLDRALMNYYAPSAAMTKLLPRLLANSAIPVPTPLWNVAVMDQVAAGELPKDFRISAASTAVSASEVSMRPFNGALIVDTVQLDAGQNALIRTLFYEGILTFEQGRSSLRVSNDAIRLSFLDHIAAHLRKDMSCLAAAEDFILRGNWAPLATQLTRLTRPGLIGQGVPGWYECHASQRLLLLLTCASVSTSFRWMPERSVPRIRVNGSRVDGAVDLCGTGLLRSIFIEVKQVNVRFDIAAFSARLGAKRGAAQNNEMLACANDLVNLSDAALLDLAICPDSIKQCETARSVRDSAVLQAQDYARGWLPTQAGEALSLYVAISFGPLRWYFEHVPWPPVE